MTKVDDQATEDNLNQLTINWETCSSWQLMGVETNDISEWTSTEPSTLQFQLDETLLQPRWIMGPFQQHWVQINNGSREFVEYNCETYQGCVQVAQFKILSTIDTEWLAGIISELLVFKYARHLKQCMITYIQMKKISMTAMSKNIYPK